MTGAPAPPPLTTALVRRLERLTAPALNEPGPGFRPHRAVVRAFGATIAARRRGGRPQNKVYGFGPDDLERLDEILEWYREEALDPWFYLSPVGFSPAVAAALTAAGFAQREFLQAALYGIPATVAAPLPRGVTIERVTESTRDECVVTLARGFEWPPEWREAAMEEMRANLTPESFHFLARCDGRPAGVAFLEIRDDAARLGGGAVVPEFRGRGCHGALIRHRIHLASTLGATLITGGADFGGGSFRNQLRAGLRLAYVESGWARADPA